MPANQVSNDTIANPWAYVDLTSNSEFVVAYTPPNGCTKYDTINIPTQEFNNTISDDTSICTSDNVQLSASGEANTFTWLPDATLSCTNCPNPVANPDTVTTYKVLLQDTTNGCEQLKSVTVSFQTPQITFIDSPELLCPNGSDSLFVEDAGDSYLWSNQDSGSGIEITQPGTYSVTATDQDGCSNEDSITVGEYDVMNVQFLDQNPDTICLGQNYNIGVKDIYQSYEWSTGDTTPVTTISTVGYHAVTVTDTNGCTNADSTFIDAYSDPQPQIVPPTIGCANGNYPDTLTLMEEYVSYAWSTGDEMDMTVIDSNGTYSVTVTDTNDCTGSDQMSATIGAIDVELTTEDTAVVQGESTTLNANASSGNAPYTYTWDNDNPDEDVSGQSGSSIQVTPQSPTIYEVTAMDADSCMAIDTVFVDVEDEPRLVVPGAFSPNDDGRNDQTMPLTKGPVEIVEFKIFNRWGEELFSMQGQSGEGWDGTYNGNKQPVGTYVYYLIYRQDGEEKKESGSISLVR
jgi:gliding motility-associated-like protein